MLQRICKAIFPEEPPAIQEVKSKRFDKHDISEAEKNEALQHTKRRLQQYEKSTK